MKLSLLRCMLTGLCLLMAGNAWATRWVEATGSAPINMGATQLAREQAVQNAIQSAMLQTAAKVDSTATVSANVLIIESSRVNAAGTVEDVRVLDEWLEDEVYYVRIRAHVPAHKVRTPSPAARYRKKVAVLQFEVADRRQVHDLPGVEQALPRELLRRLETSGNYVGVDATRYLASKITPGYRLDEPEVYAMLADQLGAQIVISGVIRDLGVKEGWVFNSRQLEVEIFVHDGISGARIARHLISENVRQTDFLEQPDATLFSNAQFLQTRFGRALDLLLNRQVEMVHEDLEQLPFSARVVEVNGKEVYFDAGGTSLVRVGDVLMTYRMEAEALRGRHEKFLGYRETPLASLAVQQIQPHFSIGKLETEEVNLAPGDIIRFGW